MNEQKNQAQIYEQTAKEVERIHLNRAMLPLTEFAKIEKTHKFEDAFNAIFAEEKARTDALNKRYDFEAMWKHMEAVTVKSTYTNATEPKASTASLQARNGKQLTVVYVPKMKKGVIEIDGEEYAISKSDADKLRAWYRANLNAKQARAERTASIANYTSKPTDRARVEAIRKHYSTAVERIRASLARAERNLQIVDNFLTSANCDAMLDKINAARLAKVEIKQRAEYAKLDEYRKIFNILVKLNKFDSVEEARTAYIKDGVNGIGAELFNTAMALVRLSK